MESSIPEIFIDIVYREIDKVIETKQEVSVVGASQTDKKTTKISKEFKFGAEKKLRIASGVNLLSFRMSNGENDRSNSCQISFYDEDWKIDKFLFDRFLKIGGIDVPKNLFKDPPEASSDEQTKPTSAYNPKNGMKGEELAKEIIKYCRGIGVNDKAHIAAILGNIEIETNMGIYTEEIGGSQAWYAPYYGRGLIQITHKDNYERFGKFFKQDFLTNLILVADLKWAIPIAVGGMTGVNGCPLFTGKKLSDYGSGSTFDFVSSRQTVNGLDKADYVASEALKWYAKIDQLALTDTSQSRVENTYLPGAFDSANQAKVALEGVKIVSDWSMEISVNFGYSNEPIIINSGFWLTEHSTNSSTPQTTTIGGRGLRSILNKTDRKTYFNISLRQLMERIGQEYGAKTIIPSNPATNKILDKAAKKNETDYQFLLRVAQSLGFELLSTGQKLQLLLPKKVPTVKLKPEWMATFSTSESANAQRILKELPPISELVDGKTIGEGFSSQISIGIADIDALSLQPSWILEIPEGAIPYLPNEYCREYKIKAVNVQWQGIYQVSLDLYIPVNIEAEQTEEDKPNSSGTKKTNATGNTSQIVAAAKKWVGKDFLPGQRECCMRFVRQVLKECNHPKADFITATPHDGIETGIALASSLSGSDCGVKILDVASLNPGDIVFWGGTYGGYPPSTITHVGIKSDLPGQIIDRSTSSEPVRERPITTFQYFTLGVRLSD